MARITLEELRKDPLIKGDFELMNKMGVPENKPWEFVCKILDFCDTRRAEPIQSSSVATAS